MLAINEIFYSLQGEGDFVGQPMTFIRLAGCNLRCAWCDQPDTIVDGFTDRHGMKWLMKYDKMSEEAIVKEVLQYPTRHVCLTGGEPSTHKLTDLIQRLKVQGKKIHMESNGTKFPTWLPSVDHLVVSPKREAAVNVNVKPMAREFKFIVDKDFYIGEALDVVGRNLHLASLYLQPANEKDYIDKTNLQKTIGLVQRHPQFKLSVQLHKYLEVK